MADAQKSGMLLHLTALLRALAIFKHKRLTVNLMRGKVLRDASNGNGLISSGGKQFEFSLEKNWKSDVTPKIGMVVEFELGVNSEIQSAHAINENQLAKEQAELALAATREKGMALCRIKRIVNKVNISSAACIYCRHPKRIRGMAAPVQWTKTKKTKVVIVNLTG